MLGGRHLRKAGSKRQQDSRRACRVSGSAAGQPNTYIGSLSSNGLKFGIVAARFNELVTKPLLEGVLEGLERHGTPRETADVRLSPLKALNASCMNPFSATISCPQARLVAGSHWVSGACMYQSAVNSALLM